MNSDASITESRIEAEILDGLARRDENASVCPSEIARALAGAHGTSWRALMPRIRNVARRMALNQQVIVTRGTTVLSPDNLQGGPIRIRRGGRFNPDT